MTWALLGRIIRADSSPKSSFQPRKRSTPRGRTARFRANEPNQKAIRLNFRQAPEAEASENRFYGAQAPTNPIRRIVMNRRIRLTTLVLIVFAMFVVSTAPSALAQTCSLAGAAGPYGFTANGTLLLPTGAVLIAAVGRVNLHADGTLSGTQARSVGGDFANETFAGTWTVNANCRVTVTATVFVSGVLVRTSVLVGVFDQNMTEIRNVQKSLTLPDSTNVPVVITFEGRRIF